MVLATASISGAAMVLGAAALGVGGAYASSAMGGKGKPAPKPMAMPSAPQATDATGKAEDIARKRQIARKKYQSIFTSPLGISGQADVAKKQLLGQ